ncbi:MAG: alpha/beta hydrolase family protein [Anaerolineaceae bacterium]|nr:alpha/beta hydrolase family protein [Anaerolineaceae bacterium]
MSRFQCTFQSIALNVPTTITVTLPFPLFDARTLGLELDDFYPPRQKFKCLYLLHGAFSDSSSWSLRSRIEEYADRHRLAVIMPNVGNSFYADLLHGPAYWTFVSEELPRFVRSVFPLSERREDNFVAGLSMGGYGAFKLALNKPQNFAAGISLSGVLDIVDVMHAPIHPLFDVNEYYGGFEQLEGSANDLFAQLGRLKQQGAPIPRLYMACGLEDSLYAMNAKFRDWAQTNSVPVTYEEGPGDHDWDFWDPYIRRALDWIDVG